VAVFQDSTPNWIVSLISIFWAGAVYVPLVRINPMPRLAAILADDSTASLAPELQLPNTSIINVSNLAPKEESRNRTIYASAEDPALILFTSGSTGIPKGIVLRHRNLAHHIEGYVRAWEIGREIVLQQSAFSFDLSIGQIFTGLSTGGTVVVVPEKTRGDSVALTKLILKNEITWTLLTPSEYSGILESSADDLRKAISWKHALACGEALTRKLVREFKKLSHEKLRLYNAYGPVEAIISATMAEIPLHTDGDDGPVTIGVPNPNYSIYIIDEQCNILPQGFPGEILIGGCGVAVGYLNNEDLTKEKFLPNTFEAGAYHDNGWNMSYRTGDMGRLRKDGAFMYEGRREGDSQVKIRGFRVDLLDIETTLINDSQGVLYDAVVTMRPETQILIAHVIFARAQRPQDTTIYLAKLLADLPLPAYMIPIMAIPVESFPKNLHGKKDRSAIARLPLPQNLTTSSNDSAELTSVEQKLAETWREILPAEFSDLFSIESNTDFFAVGGNSLLLVKLQSCIRDAFNVSIPLLELFDVSSLSKMAARIEASRLV
jgi:hybrid polyketide synthase/nonribosomal peptide synthetase ACE1